MAAYSTLPEMLAWRAAETPTAVAFSFGEASRTFEELWREIERFAAVVAGHGLGRGDRVLVALPNGPEFFAVFYGIQRAGATAVPIFPGSGAERIADLARMARARAVVVDDGLDPAQVVRLRALLDAGEPAGPRDAVSTPGAEILKPAATPGAEIPKPAAVPGADVPRPAAAGIEVLTPAAAKDLEPLAGLPGPGPEDLAYVQYTSGSTGEPKGVQLSHANLLVNMRQMIAGMEITPADVFVSWLPVFHDMGLVLMTMVPFSLAARLVLLPTSLRDVGRWLAAIERHRGTFTAAPDFAWRLALRAAGPHDLASLRVALNAAEPVRPETLEGFASACGRAGVMVPGYGLAEATVGVSMWPPGTEAAIDERGFPSVGPPFPDVELRILGDPGALLPPGEVGEVLVRSPAATRGYLDDPEATADLFWKDGFLRTGDLGYLDSEGRLTIVGRRKNIIIHAGRNLAPSEVEQAADAPAAVRLAAAVGIDRGDAAGEQLYVFAEARAGDSLAEPDRRDLAAKIVRRVHARLGLRPARVYLLRPRSIPLTHNGKVRHRALRESYLDGSLRAAGAIVYPDW